VTLSVRPLGHAEKCSYVTEWRLERTTDAMIDSHFDVFTRVWGPSELGMALGRLADGQVYPPVEA
jgi:hypothetical protein